MFCSTGAATVPTLPPLKEKSSPLPTTQPIAHSIHRFTGRPFSTANDIQNGHRDKYLSLFLGFDHVIGHIVVDGSGMKNDANLTTGL